VVWSLEHLHNIYVMNIDITWILVDQRLPRSDRGKITPLGLETGNSRGHFEAADRTCRGRQRQPGESCCRRPNTSKFRYALINTSKLIPANIFTYILIIRDDLLIRNIASYLAAVIGLLKIWCRYDNQSASLFWVVGIFLRVYAWRKWRLSFMRDLIANYTVWVS